MTPKKVGPISINSDTITYDLSPLKKDLKSNEIRPMRNLLPELESCSLSVEKTLSGPIQSQKPSPCISEKPRICSQKSPVKPSNLKGLLREFKKYFIKDFRSFEKETKCSNSLKKPSSCDTLQSYFDAQDIIAKLNNSEQNRCAMHYSLGLLINPKFVLSCTHSNTSCAPGQSE